MSTETTSMDFPHGEDAWTEEQATALLRIVEDMFHRVDIDALVAGFTEDCVFRFSEQPEQQGRAALRRLFEARLSRQKNYRLRKTLHGLAGNILANTWEGTWDDRATGKQMAGYGVEIWHMRDAMIARWEASFSVWEAGSARKSAIM